MGADLATATDELSDAPGLARRRSWPAPLWLAPAAVAATVCAAIWPALAIGVSIAAVVCALALRSPREGFVLALGLIGLLGLLKARLSSEQTPSPAAIGAALGDLCLLAAGLALALRDRAGTIRAVWRAGSRGDRVVWSLLLAWLVVSVFQIPQTDLVDGLEGFRLTQLYVLLVIPGAALFAARVHEERLARGLLALFAVVAGYAALRTFIGAAAWETTFVFDRSTAFRFIELDRTVGSFVSPFDLASFLVPVAAFSLILALLHPRLRVLAGVVFALAMVAIVGSYVRTALLAVGLAAIVVAVLVVLARDTPRRAKLAAVGATVLLLVGGALATVLVGGANEQTQERARGFVDPFEDKSLKIRWEYWERSVEKTADNPFGTGLGTVGRATQQGRRLDYVDNSYLKVLQEQGFFFGSLFVIGVLGTLVMLGRRLARAQPTRTPVATAAFGAAVAFFVLCIATEYIETSGKVLAWSMLGAALSYAYAPARAATRATTANERRRGPRLIERARALGRPERAVLAATVLLLTAGAALVANFRAEEYRAGAVLVAAGEPVRGAPSPLAFASRRSTREDMREGLERLRGPDKERLTVGDIRVLPSSRLGTDTVGVTVGSDAPVAAARLRTRVALNLVRASRASSEGRREIARQLRETRAAVRRQSRPTVRRQLRRDAEALRVLMRALPPSTPLRIAARSSPTSDAAVESLASALPGATPERRDVLWAAVAGLLVAGILVVLRLVLLQPTGRPHGSG